MWTSNSGENASKAFARESRSGKGHAGKTCAREREACEREKRTWSNDGGDRGRGIPVVVHRVPPLWCAEYVYMLYTCIFTRGTLYGRLSLHVCARV